MAAHTIDHVVVGISDLEVGIAAFASLTGVTAAYGGAHPTTGTHNALASLGDDVYLEILSPNPDVTPDPDDTLAPDATDVGKIVDALTLPLEACRAETTGLTLELSCPKSVVTLGW